MSEVSVYFHKSGKKSSPIKNMSFSSDNKDTETNDKNNEEHSWNVSSNNMTSFKRVDVIQKPGIRRDNLYSRKTGHRKDGSKNRNKNRSRENITKNISKEKINDKNSDKNKKDSGWKRKTIDITTEEGQKEMCVKLAKGCLNKMTESTFDKLSETYLQIAMRETVSNEREIMLPGILKLLIDQIFEQALLQPSFCELY